MFAVDFCEGFSDGFAEGFCDCIDDWLDKGVKTDIEREFFDLCERIDMFDSGKSGTGTLMVPGMLGMLMAPEKVLSSGSISGSGGVLLDVSVGEGLYGFPLDFCEGVLDLCERVLDFCEALEDFPVRDWDLVVGGPV